MIHCDFCDKDINTLKDVYHSIPINDFKITFCDDCYLAFKEHLTIEDIMEGLVHGED